MQLSRRDLLKVGLFSSAALMLPAERIARTKLAVANRIPQSELPQPFTLPFKQPPILPKAGQVGNVDYYVLNQIQTKANILPDRQTTIWGYNGITPGPAIVNQQGRSAVVRQICSLPDTHPELGYNVWTSTHLHGSCSLPQYDGYASDITPPGSFKDYQYPNIQDARTLWYHDHGVHITATNAYMGLAAQYILHDPVEQALPIPHGQYDVQMTLKDVMFQKNGELVIDFAKYKPGQRVVLKNSSPKNNIDYDTTNVICAFVVKDHVTDSRNNEVPQDLNPNMRVMGLTEADSVATRTMRFERKNGHWTVNGQTWEDVVNSDYELTVANPKFGDVEIWELENPGGGWFHPVHIHLVDFKVLDRDGRAPEPYEQGPKDVVYVGESETVRVIMRFENQRGKYMMHCHNLVHEDHDMMVQFEVGDGGDDPIKADPCRSVSEMTDLLPARDNSGPGSGSTPGG